MENNLDSPSSTTVTTPAPDAAVHTRITKITIAILSTTSVIFACTTCYLLIPKKQTFKNVIELQSELPALSQKCDAYFMHKQSKNYFQIFQECSNQFKSTIQLESYVKYETNVDAILGPVKSLDFVDYRYITNLSTKWHEIIYNCKFKNGTAMVVFRLEKTGNTFKINGINYGPPELFDK